MFYSVFFFFKQKTAYDMRISDWSSDVCSSDLHERQAGLEEIQASKCRELVEHHQQLVFAAGCPGTVELLGEPAPDLIEDQPHQRFGSAAVRWRDHEIGRASCRERVFPYVALWAVAVSIINIASHIGYYRPTICHGHLYHE